MYSIRRVTSAVGGQGVWCEEKVCITACVINLPCAFNRYLDMSSLQFCFMIWIVIF